MQYLLTQAEYDELISRVPRHDHAQLMDTFQDLCTKVADHMPVKWTWGEGKEKPMPWGCIITAAKNGDQDWCCDECPVQKVCPAHKHWSQ